jgi:hypothetical protein
MFHSEKFISLALAAESLEDASLRSAAIELLKFESGYTFCECCGKVITQEECDFIENNESVGEEFDGSDADETPFYEVQENFWEEDDIAPEGIEETFAPAVASLEHIVNDMGIENTQDTIGGLHQFIQLMRPDLVVNRVLRLYLDDTEVRALIEDYYNTPF